MIDLCMDRTDKVHKELAQTGKYFNTGKVLIGVSYVPRPRTMTRSEEQIQSALLKSHGSRITPGMWGYMALAATATVCLLLALTS